MIDHNIVLNVKQSGVLETGIEVTQGDFGKVRFSIRAKDDDAYIMDATSASLIFKLSNGYTVEGSADISAGTYNYIFEGNELQSPGKVSATLTLEYGAGRVSSCPFTFNVRYNPLYDNYFKAGPYIPALERIREQAQAQVDYLQQLIAGLQAGIGEAALTRADVSNSLNVASAGITVADSNTIKQLFDRLTTALTVNQVGQFFFDAAGAKIIDGKITELNNNLLNKLAASTLNPTVVTQENYSLSGVKCILRAGWVFVAVDVTVNAAYGTHPGITCISGLPGAAVNIASVSFPEWSSLTGNQPLRVYISENGTIALRSGTVGKVHPTFFSYPAKNS